MSNPRVPHAFPDDRPLLLRLERSLALGLHPHLMGVPHRFAYFEQMLDLLMRHPKTCFMTGGQIADWFKAQRPAIDSGVF